MPWRDGGARSKRQTDWIRRAAHAVEDALSLGAELVEIDLWSTERPEACIYRFDQVAASRGWRYHAELRASGFRNTRFRVVVAQEHEHAARAAARNAERM